MSNAGVNRDFPLSDFESRLETSEVLEKELEVLLGKVEEDVQGLQIADGGESASLPPSTCTIPTVPTFHLMTNPMSLPELHARVESNQVLVQEVNARLSLTEDKVAALEKKDHGTQEELNLFLLQAPILLGSHPLPLIPTQSLTTD